jgi:hypothetical protein
LGRKCDNIRPKQFKVYNSAFRQSTLVLWCCLTDSYDQQQPKISISHAFAIDWETCGRQCWPDCSWLCASNWNRECHLESNWRIFSSLCMWHLSGSFAAVTIPETDDLIESSQRQIQARCGGPIGIGAEINWADSMPYGVNPIFLCRTCAFTQEHGGILWDKLQIWRFFMSTNRFGSLSYELSCYCSSMTIHGRKYSPRIYLPTRICSSTRRERDFSNSIHDWV